jgi:hypothetical protein
MDPLKPLDINDHPYVNIPFGSRSPKRKTRLEFLVIAVKLAPTQKIKPGDFA